MTTISLKKVFATKILHAIGDAELALEQLTHPSALAFIEKGALAIAMCFQTGCKALIAGNGGSLCDAVHFAEELTGIFRKKRRALPAIALSDPGHLTCVGNDLGFEHVFARAIEAYGKQGDLFIGLTTSGNSANMVLAFERAKELGLSTLAFLGKGGGKLKGCADVELIIEGFETSDRIQEAHMTAIHIMIELVEELLFNQSQEEMLKQITEAVRG
jgi:D-sedoheptulose 7-phosphate isomerase